MTDWSVGDLAVCVDARPPANATGRGAMLSEGRIYTVLAVVRGGRGIQLCGMGYERFPERAVRASRFRKIRPDEQSGELSDWELLMDAHTRKVRA